MTLRLFIATILILSAIQPTYGREYLCRYLTVDDGLTQSNVTSIVRDAKGFLWIGSRFGLNRYDFTDINNYYHDSSDTTSIPDNYVSELFVDSRDTLWVAGEKGVAYLRRSTNKFIRVDCDDNVLNARSFFDEGNGLLIGGDGILYFYDFAGDQAKKLQTKGGSNFFYTAIHYWRPGYYVLATRWDGLWLFDRSMATISRLPWCPEKRIMASLVDSRGRLWVSVYGKGVFCYERDGSQSHTFSVRQGTLNSDIVLDIIQKDNEIWLATDGGGINIFSIPDEKMVLENDRKLGSLGSVTCLYVDRRNNVYGGTVHNGALSVRTVDIHTFHSGSGSALRLSTVSSIVYDESEGRLWIGDDGHGVLTHKESSSDFLLVKSTEGEKVISLANYDKNHLILSVFGKGPMLLNKTNGQTNPAPTKLKNLYDAINTRGIGMYIIGVSHCKLAILTDRISIYDPADDTIFQPEMKIRSNLEPFYNNGGVILYRGYNFLGEYDNLTNSIRVLHSQKDRIICAAFDGDHTVYMASEKGVEALDISDDKVTTIYQNSKEHISALAVEGDHLWIGSNNSLLMKDLKTDKTIQYGRSDGVGANEYMPMATLVTDRYLYMGGVNGLVRINRKEIGVTNDPVDSSISLSDIEIDGVSAYGNISDGLITVCNPYSYMRISVISDGSYVMHRPHYRFIIRSNNSEQIIETFGNYININSLKAGETYEIYASDIQSDGQSGPLQSLLKVAVVGPWYSSRWTWIAGFLIITVFLFFAERYRQKLNVRRLTEELVAANNSALEKEVGFFVNTNYALRTPLTMIYAPVKMLIDRINKGETTDFDSELQNIYRNTQRMRDVIDMAIEFHQSTSLTDETGRIRYDLLHAIHETIERYSSEISNKKLEVNIDASNNIHDIILSSPDRMKVVLDILIQFFINHSIEDSNLKITLRMINPDTIGLEISDSGPLLDEKLLSSIFKIHSPIDGYSNFSELAYVGSIIETLGGQIDIANNIQAEYSGISVRIVLPIELAAYQIKSKVISTPLESITDVHTNFVDIDTSEMTAVVVEEDNDLCSFITAQLSSYFKRVLSASNGKDALLIIRREMPDIVISSIMLPIKNGIELCHDIKSNDETRHIPVILLTATKEGPQLEKAYCAGADNYLSKPFDINMLLMLMRNLLHNRAVIRQRYSHKPSEHPANSKLPNADESFLLKIDQIIMSKIQDPDFSVDVLAREMNMSRTVLYSKFKAISGATVAAYINDYRLQRARSLLRDTSLTINEISEQVGFSSQRYFSTFFKEHTGMTPTAFRNEKL